MLLGLNQQVASMSQEQHAEFLVQAPYTQQTVPLQLLITSLLLAHSTATNFMADSLYIGGAIEMSLSEAFTDAMYLTAFEKCQVWQDALY